MSRARRGRSPGVRATAGDLAAQLEVPPAAIARGLLFRILTSSEQYRGHADDEALELEAERYADAVRTLGW